VVLLAHEKFFFSVSIEKSFVIAEREDRPRGTAAIQPARIGFSFGSEHIVEASSRPKAHACSALRPRRQHNRAHVSRGSAMDRHIRTDRYRRTRYVCLHRI